MNYDPYTDEVLAFIDSNQTCKHIVAYSYLKAAEVIQDKMYAKYGTGSCMVLGADPGTLYLFNHGSLAVLLVNVNRIFGWRVRPELPVCVSATCSLDENYAAQLRTRSYPSPPVAELIRESFV